MVHKEFRQWAEFLAIVVVVVVLAVILKQNGALQQSALEESLRPHFMQSGTVYWLSEEIETAAALPAGYTETNTIEHTSDDLVTTEGEANGCPEGSTIYTSENAPEHCYLLTPDGAVYLRYDGT